MYVWFMVFAFVYMKMQTHYLTVMFMAKIVIILCSLPSQLDGTSGLYYDQCKLCAPAHFSLDGKEAQRWWNNTCRVLDIDPDTLDVDAEQTYE